MEEFCSVAAALGEVAAGFHIGPSPPLALVVSADRGLTEVRQITMDEWIKLRGSSALRPWMRLLTPASLKDGRARFLFLLSSVLGQCVLPSSPFAAAHRLHFLRAVSTALSLIPGSVASAARTSNLTSDERDDKVKLAELIFSLLSTHVTPVLARRLTCTMMGYIELRGGSWEDAVHELAYCGDRGRSATRTRMSLVNGDALESCVIRDAVLLSLPNASRGYIAHRGTTRTNGLVALIVSTRKSSYEGMRHDSDSDDHSSSSSEDEMQIEGQLTPGDADQRVVESAREFVCHALAAHVDTLLVAAVLPNVYFQYANEAGITMTDGLNKNELEDFASRLMGRATTVGFGTMEAFHPLRYCRMDFGKEMITAHCEGCGPSLLIRGPHPIVRRHLSTEVMRAASVVHQCLHKSRENNIKLSHVVVACRGSFRKNLEAELRLAASCQSSGARFVLGAFADAVHQLDRHLSRCIGASAGDEDGSLEAVETWEDVLRAVSAATMSMARVDGLVAVRVREKKETIF